MLLDLFTFTSCLSTKDVCVAVSAVGVLIQVAELRNSRCCGHYWTQIEFGCNVLCGTSTSSEEGEAGLVSLLS